MALIKGLGSSEEDVKLYRAALGGKWKEATKYLGNDINRYINTDQKETTLHIATLAGKEDFVKKLVTDINSLDLEAANSLGNNALCYASLSGNVNIAKVMVEAGNESLRNPNNGVKPLLMAAGLGHREMVRYLFDKTDVKLWKEDEKAELFTTCIAIGMSGDDSDRIVLTRSCSKESWKYSRTDIASKMFVANQSLARATNKNGETALLVFARTPSAFANQSQPAGLFKRFLNSCTKLIHCGNSNRSEALQLVEKILDCDVENKISSSEEVAELLYGAAEVGNVDFLIKLIQLNPNLLWTIDQAKGSIFHVAVENRHEEIFSLLLELGAIKDLIAKRVTIGDKNNMLHLAAKLAPREKLNSVCGAALQMNRELRWFKEVENIVPTPYKDMENSEGYTPRALFAETHKSLREEGEKWMKDTAKSSMVVATLIATVMFTSALEVPDGFKEHDPLNQKLFVVFLISIAIGLFSSSVSILMLLSILTSRYAKEDFLESVPSKLLIGFASLFISMTAMIVAFSTTFILYHPKLGYNFVLFILSYLPFIYILLVYRLLGDLIQSIRGSSSLFQPRKCLFH